MKYQVAIKETRELVFEVEADDEAEAIAMDADTTEAVRDQYDERVHDWTQALSA